MCNSHYTDDSYLKVPLEKAAGPEFYRELHKIADKAEPEVRRLIMQAFDNVGRDASATKLQRAVADNNFNELVKALGITEAQLNIALGGAIDVLRQVFDKAARQSIYQLPKRVQVGMRFDALNPKAVEYIRQQAANLVTNISETTRLGIRALIEDSFAQGIPTKVVAQRVKQFVGLTPRHMKAVENHRAMLLSEGLAPAKVEKRVERYKERLLRWRARNIARTETIKSANAGNFALHQQAVEQGLLDANKTYKKWLVAADDRLCNICRPIPGDNPHVLLNENFTTSAGMVPYPPAHPQCRCAYSLAFV